VRKTGLVPHNDSEASRVKLNSAVILEEIKAEDAIDPLHDGADEDVEIRNPLALDPEDAQPAASGLCYR